MKRKPILLITGYSSSLWQNFISNQKFNLSEIEIVAIGRSKPKNKSILFIQQDLSIQFNETALCRLDDLLKGREIKYLLWLAGNYQKSNFSKLNIEKQMNQQLNISVLNLITICNRYQKKFINGCSIVSISSLLAIKESPNSICYSIGKAAQLSLVKNLALALGPQGVRVNSISPSLFESKMSKEVFSNEIKLNAIKERTPLRKVPEVDSISNLLYFLITDKSSDITGQNFIIDCGNSLGF